MEGIVEIPRITRYGDGLQTQLFVVAKVFLQFGSEGRAARHVQGDSQNFDTLVAVFLAQGCSDSDFRARLRSCAPSAPLIGPGEVEN